MPDSVEDVVRGALKARASEITAERLLECEMRPRRRFPRRIALAAVACGVAIVVGGSVTGYALATRHSSTTAAEGVGSTAYVGSRWALVSIRHGGTQTVVPPTLNAYVEFDRDGRIVMSDGGNTLSGSYAITPDGFQTMSVGESMNLYAPPSATAVLVTSAIHAIVRDSADEVSSPAVKTHVIANALLLDTSGYELVFNRQGPAQTQASPQPTETSSRTA